MYTVGLSLVQLALLIGSRPALDYSAVRTAILQSAWGGGGSQYTVDVEKYFTELLTLVILDEFRIQFRLTIKLRLFLTLGSRL